VSPGSPAASTEERLASLEREVVSLRTALEQLERRGGG